jgi:hypothetical protein
LAVVARLFRDDVDHAPPDVRRLLEERHMVFVDGTGEPVPSSHEGQENRDAFMSAKEMEGASLKEIQTAAKRCADANRWQVPTTLQGVHQAIVRFRYRNGLPRPMYKRKSTSG